jgi:hypothetical protein
VPVVVKAWAQIRGQPEAGIRTKTKIERKQSNMKRQTQTSILLRSSLALAFALVIGTPVQLRSAEPAEGQMKMDGKMMAGCQEMMDQQQKMKADMKAQDAQLTGLVAKMNSAPEDKKLDAIAAVLTQMVEQRIAMDARKAKMEEEMMQHMMQHMQMGKESMSQCPMMKGMKGMKGMGEKTAGAHEEHQEEQK